MSRVLLVEPDQLLAKSYQQALESAGHDVMWASNAQSAIMVCDEAKPDVIVLELQLVLHNGIELLYELRSYSDLQKIPVVIQSYITDVEFRVSPIADVFNIVSYLNKTTTTLRTLTTTVNQTLAIKA